MIVAVRSEPVSASGACSPILNLRYNAEHPDCSRLYRLQCRSAALIERLLNSDPSHLMELLVRSPVHKVHSVGNRFGDLLSSKTRPIAGALSLLLVALIFISFQSGATQPSDSLVLYAKFRERLLTSPPSQSAAYYSGSSKILPYYCRASLQPSLEDVTLTTHITLDRFEIFSHLVERYSGIIFSLISSRNIFPAHYLRLVF